MRVVTVTVVFRILFVVWIRYVRKNATIFFYVDSVLMAGARSFSAAKEWMQADGPGVWTLVI